MTDPAEAAERVRQRLRESAELRDFRAGQRDAAGVVKRRADHVRMPCCKHALLEAAAVLDVLGLEPPNLEGGEGRPGGRGGVPGDG